MPQETIEIKERPILFSPPMVRAILSGRKGMTRRIVEPQPGPDAEICKFEDRFSCMGLIADIPDKMRRPFCCPHGEIGDRLWVKEGFRYSVENDNFYYVADNQGMGEKVYQEYKGRHPNSLRAIFMPRWASRITLEITGVKVERLHEISEEDAEAEGCKPESNSVARSNFIKVWRVIHGPESWSSNPWVWAISFKKL